MCVNNVSYYIIEYTGTVLKIQQCKGKHSIMAEQNEIKNCFDTCKSCTDIQVESSFES